MVALKTADIRNEFKKVSDMVHTGEKVLISRPRNENLVILSEKEYNPDFDSLHSKKAL